MKVPELIDLLKTQDLNAMVVISGYEGGITEVTNGEAKYIALNVNSEWYYGKHEISEDVRLPVGFHLE